MPKRGSSTHPPSNRQPTSVVGTIFFDQVLLSDPDSLTPYPRAKGTQLILFALQQLFNSIKALLYLYFGGELARSRVRVQSSQDGFRTGQLATRCCCCSPGGFSAFASHCWASGVCMDLASLQRDPRTPREHQRLQQTLGARHIHAISHRGCDGQCDSMCSRGVVPANDAEQVQQSCKVELQLPRSTVTLQRV